MPGHFAQASPVLGRLVQAGPVPLHFAPAGLFFGDFARAVSLRAHYRQAGRVGAFAFAGEALGHFPQPAPGHLERTVRARLVPAHLSRPPRLGIA